MKAHLVWQIGKYRWLTLTLTVLIALSSAVASAFAVAGNISPNAIQIDTPNANLYPGGDTVNCSNANFAGSIVDWVKDCQPNTDTPSLVNSIATGIKTSPPNQTGAAAIGHWNGVRIVDGLNQNDQDIFLQGGKENDTSTWNVGPGSVGSSKYDASQAYLANNQTDLFFGMERSGNNGTTAFDFEFNQNPPAAGGSYIPTRTVGDRLFTFEMQGSGGSGSATPHVFHWNGSSYVEDTPVPAGVIASINQVVVPAAPWGYVDSQGNWTTGSIPKFEFAEAKAPLSLLPGVNACGGKAFVQVRTRSSSTASSDLKDTTKIFEFLFGGPSAKATLSTNCNAQFTYDGTGSKNASGGTTGLTYSWDITVSPATATLSGGGVSVVDAAAGKYTSTSASGTVDVSLPAGVDSATITVKNTVTENNACSDATGNKTVTVYRILGATATLTPHCDNTFDFSSTVTGGKAPYTYSWKFEKNSADDGSGTWSDVTSLGTFTAGSATSASGTYHAASQGLYRAQLTVKDTADSASSDPDVTVKPQCTANATSNAINVYNAVGGSVTLTPDCDQTFAYSATGSGGKAPYTFAWTIEKLVSGSWVTAKTFTDGPGLTSSGTLDVDTFDAGANGDGHYRARVTITDSQGIVCTFNATSNEIDVAHQLTASASKTSADGSALSVLLTGSSASGASLQWQRFDGTNWVNIAGETGTTLTYTNFENDATSSPVSFSIGADSYVGKLWTVQLRLHASRTLNGQLCEADSSPVTVKKVTGVDP